MTSGERPSFNEKFQQANVLITRGVLEMTVFLILMFRDLEEDADVLQAFSELIMHKHGSNVKMKLVNYVFDIFDEDVQDSIAIYRNDIVATLCEVTASLADTKETIRQKIIAHGGVKSYTK